MKTFAFFKLLENLIIPLPFLYLALLIFSPENVLATLLNSLALQVSIATLLFGLWLLVRQRLLFSFLILLITITTKLGFIDGLPGTNTALLDPNTQLRIAHFNVLKYNNNYEATIHAAINTRADFISFQEINGQWSSALTEALCNQYPYFITYPLESCCYGIGVFSKLPLANTGITYFEDMPNITGSICMDSAEVHFITAHTKTPLTSLSLQKRNDHLRFIGEYLESKKGPKLAVGDFNSVPWDGMIRSLRRKASLKDSRKNAAGTYPASLPLLRIPIDFILYSKEMHCTSFDTIKGTSSDHLGIVGQYSFLKSN